MKQPSDKDKADGFDRFMIDMSGLHVGIDPSRHILENWGLTWDIEGLREFVRIIENVFSVEQSFVKAQSAYFEQFGWEGMKVMNTMIRRLRYMGCITVADVKRGDVYDTAEAYADAWLTNRGIDGITVVPWFGRESLQPYITKARQANKTVYLVCRSSNSGSEFAQCARNDTESVAEKLCDFIQHTNKRYHKTILGAVIGATQHKEIPGLAARLGGAPILAPGIGPQGGTMKQLKQSAGRYYEQIMPCISRGILRHGPDPYDLIMAIRDAKLEDNLLRQENP